MATAKRAETAQELREKYQRKRLTPSTAAKVYLYNYVYWAFLTNERKPIDHLRDRVFKDEGKVFELLMKDLYAEGLYRFYCIFCIWLNTAMESAVLMRNSLNEFIMYYYDIVATAIAGENLRRELGDQAHDDKIALWLKTLTVDQLRPTGMSYHKIIGLRYSLRSNIENYLRYLNVYNTLIATIGDMIEVPELTVFQVDMDTVESLISQLNEALEALRDEIGKREVVPVGEAQVSLSPPFTPPELEETLKAFEPMEDKAPPIPEENITAVKASIRELDQASHDFDGDSRFKAMSKDYWRR